MYAKYLVTGGAGFIGSHIAEKLLEEGHSVRILDNFSTGKRENIPNDAELVEASITNIDKIRNAFIGIEGVFHTAALPRVVFSIEKPLEAHDANINGTLNVLLAARDAGVKRVVYSASSSAYGDQEQLPLHEDMSSNPKSPYGLQKYVGEKYCKIAHIVWGLETVSLRYFNVYGPRLAFDGAYVTVIAHFLKQKKSGQPLTITGTGEQTRDFTYIDDVVRANILAMKSTDVGKGEVINIGAGSNKSVNLVADHIGGPTIFIEPRLEPMHTLADTSRAKILLGWKPLIPFEDGIRRTIEWFENIHSIKTLP